MALFVVSVTTVLAVWAICSLAEAAIYAVRLPYVRQLEQSGADAGRILALFKENMERPISAILIVNTVVAAAGASIVGAQAAVLFGDAQLWLFSAVFTVAALLISEIAPKILGVAYNRQIAKWIARPLAAIVVALYPFIWVIERGSALIKPRVPPATAPEDEVHQLAEISAEEGSIMPYEAELVRHVLDLDKITASQIMTPRSVVASLPSTLTLGELAERDFHWDFSRIPIYAHEHELFHWTGYVLSREVLAALAQDRFDVTLQDLAKPLYCVTHMTPGHQLLKAFLARRTHLFGVADSAGFLQGIVTLEDVLESLIGAEIVDELDQVVDMQTVARMRNQQSSDDSAARPTRH